jgi:hypothetical protein
MAEPAPLAVFADLQLLAESGDAIAVKATDSVVTVTLPRLWSRRWALGPLGKRVQREPLLARLHEGLQRTDLTLHVELRRELVARLGPQSKPTLLSRLLGLGAVEVRVFPCLRALLRR